MDCPELRPETLRRLMEKKCLWLVRMSVDDIDRLADGELLDRLVMLDQVIYLVCLVYLD